LTKRGAVFHSSNTLSTYVQTGIEMQSHTENSFEVLTYVTSLKFLRDANALCNYMQHEFVTEGR